MAGQIEKIIGERRKSNYKMKKVYKLIIVVSVFIISFLCTACSKMNSTNPEYSLPSEISEEEQNGLSLGSENVENEKSETSSLTVGKKYSYNIDSTYNFKFASEVYDVDLYEMAELDYVPILLVEIPDNKPKEESVNKLLLENYVSKLPVNQQWMDQAEIRVTYRSERYLCFEYVSHAALPDDHDDTQLIFTLDLQEEKLVDYPKIETEWRRYDKFQAGSLYKEMEQWLERTVEEQNLLRGEENYKIHEEIAECNGISFSCIQIEGMEDQEQQDRINQLLQAPLSDLILCDGWEETEEKLKEHLFESVKIYVSYKTEKWLSVVYSIQIEEASKSFGDGIADIGITINIETGERFMLDDLFEIEGLSNWLSANVYGDEKKLIDKLQGSLMTEEEITEYFSDNIIGTALNSYRYDLWSFYLSQGKLVILNGWSSFDIEIPLPEIYEYLKTDPWYD